MHDYAFQLMTLPKASTLIRDLNTRFTSFFMIFFLLFPFFQVHVYYNAFINLRQYRRKKKIS